MTEPPSDVEILLELWYWDLPDPVDVFEDRLAGELGLLRGPGCSDERWRRFRAKIIDAYDNEDGTYG